MRSDVTNVIMGLLVTMVFGIAGCGGGGSTPAGSNNTPVIDTSFPTVSSVTSSDGATSVTTGSAIYITFSEAMDNTTINYANIIITANSTQVAGTITYANNIATFTPKSNLTESTAYTLTVNNVKDIAGNKIASPYTSNFTTVPANSISGNVLATTSTPVQGAAIALVGSIETIRTTTDSNGAYKFSGFKNGDYTITASLTGYTFTPSEIFITANNIGVVGQNFTGARVLPRRLSIFNKPFNGDFLNSAPFDHDLPLSFAGGGDNDYISTWWGGRIFNVWNGHNAHDWIMPEWTPLLAVADGEIVYAKAETPWLCPGLGIVSALVVVIRHEAPDGEIFDSRYFHLNRIDVKEKELVKAGQQLGVSGMTGCTNGPHLHFEVVRRNDTNNGKPVYIDPFGWAVDGPDPWEQHPDGARSVWLWKEGEAPEGGKRIEEVWGPGILR